MQKPVQFWWVNSLPDGRLEWEKLTDRVTEKPPPETFEHLKNRTVYGNLRVENDYLIMRVFTGDQAAHEKVVQAGRDAAALAQEWMLPPAMPYVLAVTHVDKLTHVADNGNTQVTLCGKAVRLVVNVSQSERCAECVKRAGPAGLALG